MFYRIIELDKKKRSIDTFLRKAKEEMSITLLYGAKDEKFNNSVALKEYLVGKMKK